MILTVIDHDQPNWGIGPKFEDPVPKKKKKKKKNYKQTTTYYSSTHLVTLPPECNLKNTSSSNESTRKELTRPQNLRTSDKMWVTLLNTQVKAVTVWLNYHLNEDSSIFKNQSNPEAFLT